MKNKMEIIIEKLPYEVARCIKELDKKTVEGITEIRLRVARPMALKIHNRTVYAETSGYSIIPNCRSIILTNSQIEECFYRLCNNSVHSHERELAEGYISLPFGCRVGVCGTIVKRVDGSVGVRDISSLNIRISHEVKGCASVLSELNGGVLICGATHSGKTTILRDYVRMCSDSGETVALIDCRGEISGSHLSVPSLDIGINSDVIIGGSKQSGIENALRSMSPDMLAFDEIGSLKELDAIKECFNAGVRVVTTFHADGVEELLLRNRNLPILDTEAFKNIVMLDKNYKPTIYKKENLLGKNTGGYIDSRSVCFGGNTKIF